MISVLAQAGRLLWWHWPSLLFWIIFGLAGSELVMRLAIWVGARSEIGGTLLLPVAPLTLLVAYVAMLLVVRRGLDQLEQLAPSPSTPKERRRAFAEGLLAGILPFVAFYAAWGFLREDAAQYINGVLELQNLDALFAASAGTQPQLTASATILEVGPVTLVVFVAAFVIRWAYGRTRASLPRWTVGFAIYVEVLWVYIAASLLGDLVGVINSWVEQRQAMVWLAEMREGLVGLLAPLGFAWAAIEWLLGEVGGLILLPVAWLTIAGVIYGQAVTAQALRIRGRRIARIRARYRLLPQGVRKRSLDLWQQVTARFRPIGNALVLMWRAGPLLVGGYVFAFVALAAAEDWLIVGLSRAAGPHFIQWWLFALPAITLLVTVFIEPIRMSIIAATYDHTLRQLESASTLDRKTQLQDAAGGSGVRTGERNVGADAELAGGVVGKHDDRDPVEGEPSGKGT